MNRNDAEDCGQNWVLHVLQRQPNFALTRLVEDYQQHPLEARWYADVCARHFTYRFRQVVMRRHNCEVPLLNLANQENPEDIMFDEVLFSYGRGAETNQVTRGMSPELTALQNVQQAYSRQVLAQALAKLPSIQRLAVVCYYVREEPIAQIARASGSSEASIKQALYRARQTLRQQLDLLRDELQIAPEK